MRRSSDESAESWSSGVMRQSIDEVVESLGSQVMRQLSGGAVE